MELFRVHAYAIAPHRTSEGEPVPNGGAVTVNADLRAAIEGNIKAARFDQRIAVDFRTDEETRYSAVRSLIMDFAFGEPSTASSAAKQLAARLAKAMDQRSASCLFVPAAMREDSRRRVTLWTFPRDDAFQFRSGSSGPSIEVLTDVFSQSSNLRKAAQFEGRSARTEFISGLVLDFQASNASHDVADFWTHRFLECNLGIAGDRGSRMLAKVVRKVYEKCVDGQDREQLHTAIMAMRNSPSRRISLRAFAERYLAGELKDAFLKTAGDDQVLNSPFNFQRTAFDETIKFRIFELQTGVFVSAPLDQIGDSVQVSGERKRRLRCEGEILEEKVRSRHA